MCSIKKNIFLGNKQIEAGNSALYLNTHDLSIKLHENAVFQITSQ